MKRRISNISIDSALCAKSIRLNQVACTLHVCTSCRPPGFPREPRENRPGFLLHQTLTKLIEEQGLSCRVNLKSAECLSLCSRPCGIALTSVGSWTYLFGDQDPDQTAEDILSCILIYIESSQGFMPRNKRPTNLRSSILGRVPPHDQFK